MAATHDFCKGIHFEHKSVVMLENEYLDYFSGALRRLTMLGKRKKPFLMMKIFIVFVFFAFATAGFAARIVPTGTVSIIEDSKVIGKFSQEAPLPEGVFADHRVLETSLDVEWHFAKLDRLADIEPDRHVPFVSRIGPIVVSDCRIHSDLPGIRQHAIDKVQQVALADVARLFILAS